MFAFTDASECEYPSAVPLLLPGVDINVGMGAPCRCGSPCIGVCSCPSCTSTSACDGEGCPLLGLAELALGDGLLSSA